MSGCFICFLVKGQDVLISLICVDLNFLEKFLFEFLVLAFLFQVKDELSDGGSHFEDWFIDEVGVGVKDKFVEEGRKG